MTLYDVYITFLLSLKISIVGIILKATIYTISSDTHQLQLIKLHHFKQEIF